jgi:membrane protease YdiL (CAAX protease family)
MAMVTQEATSSSPPDSAGLITWINRHALLVYLVLTFGLTWPWMWAEVLGSRGAIPFRLTLVGTGLVLTLFVAYGPTLAALIVTGLTRGRTGIRALLGRLLIWRVGWRWYAAACLLPGLIGVGATQLAALRGVTTEPLPAFSWQTILLIPVALLARGLVNGEEIGWRGVALPQLQQRWNALTASLILGGVWALFHLPIFFVQGENLLGSQNAMHPLAFLVEVVAGSILVTWLCNNTQGSLLIAFLYHAAVNTWTSEVFHLNSVDSALVTGLVAILVVLRFGPDRLVRRPASTNG